MKYLFLKQCNLGQCLHPSKRKLGALSTACLFACMSNILFPNVFPSVVRFV